MLEPANLCLIILGLIPIIISALLVEKYYTSYWIAFWNLYGSTLTILGFITSEGAASTLIIAGWIAIVIIIVLILISYEKEVPKIIRLAGKSVITTSVTVFFATLYFTNVIWLSVSFGIFFLFFLIISFMIVKEKRFRYPEFLKFQICLIILFILNLAINIPLIIYFAIDQGYALLVFSLIIGFSSFYIGLEIAQ